MLNFEYMNPTKIIFGKGQIANLMKEIPKDAKVMMLYGGGSIKSNGIYEQVIQALKDFEVIEFSGIPANPEYEILMDALKIIKSENVTFMLAVGGGSVIDGVKFLSSGWSAPEGAGTWSEQRSASINLELPNVPKRKLALYLTARAFLSNAHPLQDIEVSINGTPLKTVRYFLPDPSGLRVIPIPESLDLSASEHLQVNFNFKNAITPLELGLFIDGRPLGINIQSLELKSIY